MSKVLMPMPTAQSICARPSTGDKPFPRVCAGEPMPPIEPQPRSTRDTDNPDPPNRRRSTARQPKRPLGPLGSLVTCARAVPAACADEDFYRRGCSRAVRCGIADDAVLFWGQLTS